MLFQGSLADEKHDGLFGKAPCLRGGVRPLSARATVSAEGLATLSPEGLAIVSAEGSLNMLLVQGPSVALCMASCPLRVLSCNTLRGWVHFRALFMVNM